MKEKRKKIIVKNNESELTTTVISSFPISYSLIKDLLLICLNYKNKLSNKFLGICITTDKKIKKLNKIYLNKNQSTDVLSFTYSEDNNPNYLGDIVISYETAEEQAHEYNSSLEKELCLLIVHGILHLLGYTDYNNKEQKKMCNIQSYILNKLP